MYNLHPTMYWNIMNMEDKVKIMNLNIFVFVDSVVFMQFPEFIMCKS